ncbi:MAG TPA: hypothetical protein VIW26_04325 [Gemmatimonadales bacterium]
MRPLFAVMTCLAAARALAGQSRWDRQVDARLAQAAATLGHAYRSGGVAGRGSLNTGESLIFSLTLPAGAATVLTGVCDDDCAALELSVSTNGYEVAAARGSGNAPIVRLIPAASTAYTVTARMASCRVNPCWFAVGVFRPAVTAPHPPAR